MKKIALAVLSAVLIGAIAPMYSTANSESGVGLADTQAVDVIYGFMNNVLPKLVQKIESQHQRIGNQSIRVKEIHKAIAFKLLDMLDDTKGKNCNPNESSIFVPEKEKLLPYGDELLPSAYENETSEKLYSPSTRPASTAFNGCKVLTLKKHVKDDFFGSFFSITPSVPDEVNLDLHPLLIWTKVENDPEKEKPEKLIEIGIDGECFFGTIPLSFGPTKIPIGPLFKKDMENPITTETVDAPTTKRLKDSEIMVGEISYGNIDYLLIKTMETQKEYIITTLYRSLFFHDV
ncbi:MAG: hypothetical protein NTW04_02375 [Elusimicrobia bacterium]|nr:hypothetical protein [Elusimicrobiota bacterium]